MDSEQGAEANQPTSSADQPPPTPVPAPTFSLRSLLTHQQAQLRTQAQEQPQPIGERCPSYSELPKVGHTTALSAPSRTPAQDRMDRQRWSILDPRWNSVKDRPAVVASPMPLLRPSTPEDDTLDIHLQPHDDPSHPPPPPRHPDLPASATEPPTPTDVEMESDGTTDSDSRAAMREQAAAAAERRRVPIPPPDDSQQPEGASATTAAAEAPTTADTLAEAQPPQG